MSKKIENPSIQAVIYFVATFVISLILWPLLDMLLGSIFTHAEFVYKPTDYIIEPLVFAAAMTAIFYIPQIIKYNKANKTAPKTKKK